MIFDINLQERVYHFLVVSFHSYLFSCSLVPTIKFYQCIVCRYCCNHEFFFFVYIMHYNILKNCQMLDNPCIPGNNPISIYINTILYSFANISFYILLHLYLLVKLLNKFFFVLSLSYKSCQHHKIDYQYLHLFLILNNLNNRKICALTIDNNWL